jgi:hypothetical protein
MSFEQESQVFKIPHLRNLYQKVGMFGMSMNEGIIPGSTAFFGDQVRGFGFVHDGGVDTLFRFHSTPFFNFPGGDAQRRQVEQFMFAFDSNLAPIVGQQITIDNSNASVVNPRIDLMLARAVAGECDVVVKGVVGGVARGWFVPTSGSVVSDKVNETPAQSEAQLRSLAATPGQSLTYTAVPKGSGTRIGVDRDEDGVRDGDDVCPSVADPGQADSDGDGRGDACDKCTLVVNADQRDTNGDGYGNRCDADLNNDANTNTLDLNIFKLAYRTALGDPNYSPDADLNGDATINTLDLNILKALYRLPPGPSALVAP